MDSMQNMSGPRAQRYRPASEFDEATLARKREYWRTKKREQRAKLSVLKKERLKAANTRVCKARASAGHLTGDKNEHKAVALEVPGPTFLKSDGNYQAGLCHGPSHEFEKISHHVETGENVGPTSNLSSELFSTGQFCAPQGGQPNQKDRWFQKIKLNNVLPQFPTASPDSRNNLKGTGRKAVGCSSIGAVSGKFSPTKLNGAPLDSSSQVPAINIKVQPTVSVHFEDQNEKALLNGSSSTTLPQHNVATQAGSCLQDIPTRIELPVQSPGPGSGHANVPEVSKYTQMDILESTIKKEVDDLLPDIGSLIATHSNNQAVFPKAEEPNEKEVMNSVAVAVEPAAPQQVSKATIWQQKLQDGIERWGAVRSRTHRQKLLESQRMISQRSVRRAFSPAMALSTKKAQKSSGEETNEDKMARKREYWRTKKREQRAKLSVEVKAKMKERDSLLRRVKRYQCILTEMRRARTGCNKSRQPPGSGNPLSGDNETIGGFIKEDGTMTTNIPQASANYRLSERETLPESRTFPKNPIPVTNYGSGNAVLRKQMQITAPPPLKCVTQMKGSRYPNALSSLNPPRLVSNRARTASHTTPKNLQNTHTTMPQTNNSLRRLHNVQSVYPRLTLLKQRQSLPQITRVVGKQSATPLQPGGFALKGVPAGSSCPTTALSVVPELTEEERMAKKREYWRIKKREQRAKRSARARQTLFQCKYSSAIQRQQSQRALSVRRTASLNSLRGISVNCPPNSTLLSKPVVPTSVQDKQASIKQEEEPGPTEDACPGPDPALCPEIKPSLSPPTEQQVEQDPTTMMDSQATTLLAVASMKKLLEESLSSVADSNDLPPCKREQVSSEEEVAQVEVKPSLTCLSQAHEEYAVTPERHHSALGSTTQSTELHPCQAQSPSCLKPSQVLSTSQPASSQSPASSQAGSPSSNLKHSHTPLSRQSLTHAPSCSHVTSFNQPLQLRRAQRLRAKRIGHHCCSPEHPKKAGNPPSQPEEDVLRKKREYWRVAKREQRAKKASQEREMRKSREQGKQIPRPSQVAPICTVKTHKPELRNEGHNRPPALHKTNSPPLVLSSTSGTLTSLKSVTTLPILKVFTPVQSTPRLCPTAFENKAPARDPSKPSRLPAADSHASLNNSTLPCPTGGKSRDAVQSGSVASPGRLLLLESQQNRPPGSSTESLQVKRWQLQVQEGSDTFSSQSAFPKKLPSSALQVGGTASLGGGETLAGRPNSHSPPSCNVQLHVGPEDARKPPDSPKPTKTPKQLDEDLRKKREYWRVKKKEQRARKAARERETKRQGTPGGWRTILPAKEDFKSLESQEQVSNPWPNSALKDSQLLPSTSSKYNDQPQRGLTGSGKDELDMGMEAGEEEEEEEEEEEGEEEGHEDTPSSEACWRTQFLMDFDPLNQLLVCMVCGEQQHTHSLEGVRGHIEEAHPDTLSLDPHDRHRILEAWDEQVFLRERFFSNQLQQRSGVLSGESQERPAEVEVMVDLEESPALKNLSKASKTKSLKKV